MKIVFMGTPEFAVPSLARLYADGYDLCGVFTQPDKPKNRGLKLTMSPVKEVALTHNTPIYQPVSMKDGRAVEILKELNPDLIVVAAYGKLLPPAVLEIPAYGCINVHSSLLPRYRGAAPIHRAVLGGESETGVTIMYMASELDAGDIISASKTPIAPDETAQELHDRLMLLGAELLSNTIRDIASGCARRTQQNHALATYAHMLDRDMSPIDWKRTSVEIINHIRGLIPWPVASAQLAGKKFKIYRAIAGKETKAPAGTIVGTSGKGIEVACGDGNSVIICELQAEGGKRMKAEDYLRGHPMA